RNITIIYDGDAAGMKASLRGIDIILEQGMHVRVVPLPDGEDPDSFAHSQSSSEFLAFIDEHEEDFISFKARLLSVGVGNDPVKRASLISDVVRSVAAIPDRLERSLYLAECGRILKVEEDILFAEAAKIRRRQWEQKRRRGDYYPPEPKSIAPKQQSSQKETVFFAEEKEIIRLMLIYGDQVITEIQPTPKDDPIKVTVIEFILQEFDNDPLDFHVEAYQKIFSLIRDNWGKPDFHFQNTFINHSDPDISQIAVDIFRPGYELSRIHEKGGAYIRTESSMLKEVVPETIISFRSRHVKRLVTDIDDEIERLQKEGDMDGIMVLLEQKKNLDQLRMQISSDLRRIIL
ncbi:MAG: hypothetical protein J7L96_04665, partial [Bacteroidales bacterium]|nr:hypothetical protein [Bacteroidales bacterium]